MKVTLILLSLFFHHALCMIDEDPDSGIPQDLPKEALSKVTGTSEAPKGKGGSSGSTSAAGTRGLVLGFSPYVPFIPLIQHCPLRNTYWCQKRGSSSRCRFTRCDYQPRIAIYDFCGVYGCKKYRLKIHRDNYLRQSFSAKRCRFNKERCTRYGRCKKICKERWVKRSGYLWVVTRSYPPSYSHLYVSYWIPEGCSCQRK